MAKFRWRNKKGFSLVEAMLSLTVFIMLFTASIGFLYRGYESSYMAKEHFRAMLLAEESLAAVYNIHQNNYKNLIDGVYGFSTVKGYFELVPGPETIENFERSITVSSQDSERKKIKVDISWPLFNGKTDSFSVETLFTNWNRLITLWKNGAQESAINLPGTTDGSKVIIYQNESGIYLIVGRLTSSEQEISLYRIDQPDFSAPIGTLKLNGNVNDMAISGNYLYVASSSNNEELQIVDLSVPEYPAFVGGYNLTSTTDAFSVAVEGNTVYLGRSSSSAAELYTFSLINGVNPTLKSEIELGANVKDLQMKNNYLYAATSSNNEEMMVFSLADPLSPQKVSAFNAVGTADATCLVLFSNYAGISQNDGGFTVVNISNPLSLTSFSSKMFLNSIINNLSIGPQETQIFAALSHNTNPVAILDVADPLKPTLVHYISGNGRGVDAVWDENLNYVYAVTTADNAELISLIPIDG